MKILFNGEPREVAAGTTIDAVLRDCQLSPLRIAVEVNQELVPRAQLAEFALRDGDQLEVVTLVGGG